MVAKNEQSRTGQSFEEKIAMSIANLINQDAGSVPQNAQRLLRVEPD